MTWQRQSTKAFTSSNPRQIAFRRRRVDEGGRVEPYEAGRQGSAAILVSMSVISALSVGDAFGQLGRLLDQVGEAGPRRPWSAFEVGDPAASRRTGSRGLSSNVAVRPAIAATLVTAILQSSSRTSKAGSACL